ncbi:MAG: tripartite tricarboxylate transporter substrate binding protein [Hyphomicrobiales bacterium]|nr:tripartite tricarboxylate transporter substrate binding protein [Alphaproteobacteria bacterium]
MRIITAALALILGAGGALAAELNCAQVRLITPYPPGGAADVASRLIAERLEPALKKPVIVENRAGATGNIGTIAVATAAPDGCTLLNNAAVIATFPASFAKLGYDPINDLVPVGGIGITPTLLVTATANPVNDLQGLITSAKNKPDGLNFSTAGYGLLQHLAVEEIASRSGSKFVHVAYKGGAQAVTDLIADRVELGSFAAGSVLSLVKEGKLKALAVVSDKRSELIPETRTTTEQGMAGLNAGVHFMLYAPAKTPKDIVAMLSSELKKIVGDPALKQRFINIGYDPTPTSSEEMIAVMRKTGDDWTPLIKRLNIKLD